MGYHVSIPKKLLYDITLRDVDLRLYLIIADNVNEHGFSEIGNQKLIELSGRAKRSVQESLTALSDAGFIVVKHDVKKNDVYGDDLCRVIWLDEPYRARKHKKKNEKPKGIDNDFKTFVAWLKRDCVNIPFVVKIANVPGRFTVTKDGYLKELDSHDGQREKMLRGYESNDVYRILWQNRKAIIKNMLGEKKDEQ